MADKPQEKERPNELDLPGTKNEPTAEEKPILPNSPEENKTKEVSVPENPSSPKPGTSKEPEKKEIKRPDPADHFGDKVEALPADSKFFCRYTTIETIKLGRFNSLCFNVINNKNGHGIYIFPAAMMRLTNDLQVALTKVRNYEKDLREYEEATIGCNGLRPIKEEKNELDKEKEDSSDTHDRVILSESVISTYKQNKVILTVEKWEDGKSLGIYLKSLADLDNVGKYAVMKCCRFTTIDDGNALARFCVMMQNAHRGQKFGLANKHPANPDIEAINDEQLLFLASLADDNEEGKEKDSGNGDETAEAPPKAKVAKISAVKNE